MKHKYCVMVLIQEQITVMKKIYSLNFCKLPYRSIFYKVSIDLIHLLLQYFSYLMISGVASGEQCPSTGQKSRGNTMPFWKKIAHPFPTEIFVFTPSPPRRQCLQVTDALSVLVCPWLGHMKTVSPSSACFFSCLLRFSRASFVFQDTLPILHLQEDQCVLDPYSCAYESSQSWTNINLL